MFPLVFKMLKKEAEAQMARNYKLERTTTSIRYREASFRRQEFMEAY